MEPSMCLTIPEPSGKSYRKDNTYLVMELSMYLTFSGTLTGKSYRKDNTL